MVECRSSPQSALQEHSEFVLGIVILHTLVRGLLMRKVSERAAEIIQTKYRYFKSRTMVKRLGKPVQTIQRHWRGLRVRLGLYRKDHAVRIIQSNWRIILRRRRDRVLCENVEFIQAVWRGCIQRKWLNTLHDKCTLIQQQFRGHIVRLFLGKEGRLVRRAFLEQIGRAAKDDPSGVKRRSISIQYIASLEELKRKTLESRKSRARIAQRKIEQFRIAVAKSGKGR